MQSAPYDHTMRSCTMWRLSVLHSYLQALGTPSTDFSIPYIRLSIKFKLRQDLFTIMGLEAEGVIIEDTTLGAVLKSGFEIKFWVVLLDRKCSPNCFVNRSVHRKPIIWYSRLQQSAVVFQADLVGQTTRYLHVRPLHWIRRIGMTQSATITVNLCQISSPGSGKVR